MSKITIAFLGFPPDATSPTGPDAPPVGPARTILAPLPLPDPRLNVPPPTLGEFVQKIKFEYFGQDPRYDLSKAAVYTGPPSFVLVKPSAPVTALGGMNCLLVVCTAGGTVVQGGGDLGNPVLSGTPTSPTFATRGFTTAPKPRVQSPAAVATFPMATRAMVPSYPTSPVSPHSYPLPAQSPPRGIPPPYVTDPRTFQQFQQQQPQQVATRGMQPQQAYAQPVVFAPGGPAAGAVQQVYYVPVPAAGTPMRPGTAPPGMGYAEGAHQQGYYHNHEGHARRRSESYGREDRRHRDDGASDDGRRQQHREKRDHGDHHREKRDHHRSSKHGGHHRRSSEPVKHGTRDLHDEKGGHKSKHHDEHKKSHGDQEWERHRRTFFVYHHHLYVKKADVRGHDNASVHEHHGASRDPFREDGRQEKKQGHHGERREEGHHKKDRHGEDHRKQSKNGHDKDRHHSAPHKTRALAKPSTPKKEARFDLHHDDEASEETRSRSATASVTGSEGLESATASDDGSRSVSGIDDGDEEFHSAPSSATPTRASISASETSSVSGSVGSFHTRGVQKPAQKGHAQPQHEHAGGMKKTPSAVSEVSSVVSSSVVASTVRTSPRESVVSEVHGKAHGAHGGSKGGHGASKKGGSSPSASHRSSSLSSFSDAGHAERKGSKHGGGHGGGRDSGHGGHSSDHGSHAGGHGSSHKGGHGDSHGSHGKGHGSGHGGGNGGGHGSGHGHSSAQGDGHGGKHDSGHGGHGGGHNGGVEHGGGHDRRASAASRYSEVSEMASSVASSKHRGSVSSSEDARTPTKTRGHGGDGSHGSQKHSGGHPAGGESKEHAKDKKHGDEPDDKKDGKGGHDKHGSPPRKNSHDDNKQGKPSFLNDKTSSRDLNEKPSSRDLDASHSDKPPSRKPSDGHATAEKGSFQKPVPFSESKPDGKQSDAPFFLQDQKRQDSKGSADKHERRDEKEEPKRSSSLKDEKEKDDHHKSSRHNSVSGDKEKHGTSSKSEQQNSNVPLKKENGDGRASDQTNGRPSERGDSKSSGQNDTMKPSEEKRRSSEHLNGSHGSRPAPASRRGSGGFSPPKQDLPPLRKAEHPVGH
ncbi:hypothetical protein HDU96_007422 [Phlyctochytrium bullatum]|nr:hypothetical protein HDU96_007422 [Phlyctochytrium bullatum]